MVQISDLTRTITRIVQDYTTEVKEEVEKAKDEVTKNAVKKLKHAPTPKLTGRYRKGWGRVKTANGYIIRNKTDYQLTHLLEHGHAKRGGGRVEAYPHIGPIEEEAVNEFVSRVESAIRS